MGEMMSEDERYLSDDRQYVEEYSQIAVFLNERCEILEDISRRWRVSDKEKAEREAAMGRLKELDQAIMDGEWFFWEKVERSRKRGIQFIFEEIAGRYRLSHIEKRIALFFLCSRMSITHGFVLGKFCIMELFDIERSIIKKMGNLRVFDREGPLIKSGILTVAAGYDCGSYIDEYRLNSKFLKYFCQKLEGLEPDWEEMQKETKEEPNTDDIGFIKDSDFSFDDVVLPEPDKDKIQFFLATHMDNSLKNLGIDKVVKKGKGLTFLFYGPPGTGKSMLAEAIASLAGKKILVVETSKIVNCQVGETEKNISRMFESARANDTVLLLDEADSLLYSRNLATMTHTVRFTNAMLTELERFDGIAVFTSNMDSLLDEAMERRITLKVRFEVPKPEERASIWKHHIPPKVKLAEGVNFDMLGAMYEFSGGYIKNAVVNALRMIAFKNSDTITIGDLIAGAEIEKQGMFNKEQKRKIMGFSEK
jgi:SpoVK/Ycf46/Vps4 family AAA+-type ATPase